MKKVVKLLIGATVVGAIVGIVIYKIRERSDFYEEDEYEEEDDDEFEEDYDLDCNCSSTGTCTCACEAAQESGSDDAQENETDKVDESITK